MRFILLFTTLLFLFTGCGSKNTYTQISMDEAIAMMETEKDYIILDVRTLEEFKEKHIPGAICVPNETIGTEDIPAIKVTFLETFGRVKCRISNF